MQLIEVSNKKLAEDFLDFPANIYANDPNWIRPLDEDLESIFDPKRNPFFQHGKCIRWLLKNEQGAYIGRIAAFVNEKKAFQYEKPVGGLGFFECINDQKAAFALFDQAKTWLQNQGMQAVDGNINFGETDMFWGLLVEGFTKPYYGMNYNPPYYVDLFQAYGFETHYAQITNVIHVFENFPERFTKVAQWIAKKPGYSFSHFEKKKSEQFVKDMMEIYNDAWQDFESFVPIKLETIRESLQKMMPIMDPKLIWFAYINGEPASFIVILPDANQMIYNLNGKLNLISKLKFLYNKTFKVNRMRAVVMGTKKKFQNHGLESAIFIKLKEYTIPLNKYKELELSWVGDFNDKMLSLHEAIGADFAKKHLTLRKYF